MKQLFRIIVLLFLSLQAYSQTVYKTPSGAKYHLATCRMVKNVSTQVSLSEAAALGLYPCNICKPQRSMMHTSSNKAKGQNTTVQCKGLTKKGTRCLHKTSIANGYCFQHDPG